MRFGIVGCTLRVGDLVRVTFNIGAETVDAIGSVLRIRELDPITSEVSLEFVRLDPWAAQLIEQALAGRGLSAQTPKRRFCSARNRASRSRASGAISRKATPIPAGCSEAPAPPRSQRVTDLRLGHDRLTFDVDLQRDPRALLVGMRHLEERPVGREAADDAVLAVKALEGPTQQRGRQAFGERRGSPSRAGAIAFDRTMRRALSS